VCFPKDKGASIVNTVERFHQSWLATVDSPFIDVDRQIITIRTPDATMKYRITRVIPDEESVEAKLFWTGPTDLFSQEVAVEN
jgi:hypothetical protein